MGSFQLYFEMIGAVAFAVSGAALGIRKGIDLIREAMMGMTTAVGGGILRDMMLGQTPPAALRDPTQALVAIAVSVLVFYIWRWRKTELHNRYADAVLLVRHVWLQQWVPYDTTATELVGLVDQGQTRAVEHVFWEAALVVLVTVQRYFLALAPHSNHPHCRLLCTRHASHKRHHEVSTARGINGV